MSDTHERISVGMSSSLKKTAYILDINEFVPKLVPPRHIDIPHFDPHRYFITSGDAICKAKRLSKDLWAYAGQVRKATNLCKTKNEETRRFEKECWEYAGKSMSMIKALEQARGTAIFIETEWSANRILMCIPKNPKSVKDLVDSE